MTSYGDYARVGDGVIFSLPVALRTVGVGCRRQLMSLPSSRVDWELTERYAESAQYAHYAETRGERLVTWARHSHGYREDDICEIVSLLDEAMSGLMVVAGGDNFSLSFVAMTERMPRRPLRAGPILQDIIAEVMTAARLKPVPAERLSALRTVLRLLDRWGGTRWLPRDWARSTRWATEKTLEATL